MKKAFLVLSLLLTTPACALDYYFNNSEIDSDTGGCSQPVPCATLQHALHQLAASADVQDYYVSGSGNDAGACPQSAPCATPQYAIDQLMTSDNPSCEDQTVWLTGSFDAPSVDNLYCGRINIYGTALGAASLNGVLVVNWNVVDLQNLVLNNDIPGESLIYAQNGGKIQLLGGMVFGAAYGAHMGCEGGGAQINVWEPYTIINGATYHALATAGCLIGLGQFTVTIENGPTIPYFFVAGNGAQIILGGTNFSGGLNLAGSNKYFVSSNGVLNTGGLGCGNVPGSTGSTASGGVCQ